MTNPQRLQRQRTRGAKLPQGTVCVTRPTKWGNGFIKGSPGIETAAEAVRLYVEWLANTPEGVNVRKAARQELRGRNLACWCSPGSPCHADVLIEIANDTYPTPAEIILDIINQKGGAE